MDEQQYDSTCFYYTDKAKDKDKNIELIETQTTKLLNKQSFHNLNMILRQFSDRNN